jgi:hypothetical protein
MDDKEAYPERTAALLQLILSGRELPVGGDIR